MHLQSSLVQIGNWVLCHVFLKKRNGKCDEANYDDDNYMANDEDNVFQIEKPIVYYDFMSDRDAASSCSSSLSINDDANEVSSSPTSLPQPTNPPL